MKAWIARCGTYGCEKTVGVFLNEEKARLWEQANLTSNPSATSGWLQELDVLDNEVEPLPLYLKYTIIYADGQLYVKEWNTVSELRDNKVWVEATYVHAYSNKIAGDYTYTCTIYLKKEEASEELAIETAAKMIAEYKLENEERCMSLIDKYLLDMKNSKEVNNE